MAKKIDSNAVKAFIKAANHHTIYKLHMDQARQAQKQFANNPEALAKIEKIICDIKQTYKTACEKEVA